MSAHPASRRIALSPELIQSATRRRRRREAVVGAFISVATAIVLLGLLAIPLYLIAGLLPWTPLAQGTWSALGVLFSGSLRAAVCAVLVAVPLGIGCAMFSAQFCAPRLRDVLKPALELLEAVPTVVLGLVAAATLAPWLKVHVASVLAILVAVPCVLLAGGFAFGARVRNPGLLALWILPGVIAVIATALAIASHRDAPLLLPGNPWNAMLIGIALGLAAVPLVFSIAEDALVLVPRDLTQAAFALGATRWQALRSIVLPAAGPGLVAAATLGLARCLGETMIVLMASGNTPIAGFDPLLGLRSISAELALGMPDAAPASDAWRSLLLAALALLVSTLCLTSIAEHVRERLRRGLSDHRR